MWLYILILLFLIYMLNRPALQPKRALPDFEEPQSKKPYQPSQRVEAREARLKFFDKSRQY